MQICFIYPLDTDQDMQIAYRYRISIRIWILCQDLLPVQVIGETKKRRKNCDIGNFEPLDKVLKGKRISKTASIIIFKI